MQKVLIKEGKAVIQKDYDKYASPSDSYYYYVYYSNKPDHEGNYIIYTNSNHFGELRLIFRSLDKSEVIKIAENINKSMRLLAGYYDDNIKYKDEIFPSTVTK